MKKDQFFTGLLIVFCISFLNGFSQNEINNGSGKGVHHKDGHFFYKDLFVGGQDNVNQYRIPSLISTNRGTLIAVCDARVDKPGDAPNNIDLVMKRSFDNGKTWTKQRTIVNYPGNDAAGDASMVVDKQTGIIWLAYDHAVADPQGNIGRIIRIHLRTSKDDGLTWSAASELSFLTKGKSFWLQNAPGVGLYANGTIVFPMYTATAMKNGPQHTVLVISKDHGKNWLLNNGVGEFNPEPQAVSLGAGKIMVNMRTPHGHQFRQTSTTADLGNSWSEVYDDTTLIEPGCQASFINYNFDSRNLLLFSNPADTKNRKNLVLYISNDSGKTWDKKIQVYKGDAAYSCLTQLPNRNVGLLFEADNYMRIVYVEIPRNSLL